MGLKMQYVVISMIAVIRLYTGARNLLLASQYVLAC